MQDITIMGINDLFTIFVIKNIFIQTLTLYGILILTTIIQLKIQINSFILISYKAIHVSDINTASKLTLITVTYLQR